MVLYPNPAQKAVMISGLNNGTLEIYSMSGAKLYSTAFQGETQIPIDLASGIYLAKVISDNTSIIKKLIVK